MNEKHTLSATAVVIFGTQYVLFLILMALFNGRSSVNLHSKIMKKNLKDSFNFRNPR